MLSCIRENRCLYDRSLQEQSKDPLNITLQVSLSQFGEAVRGSIRNEDLSTLFYVFLPDIIVYLIHYNRDEYTMLRSKYTMIRDTPGTYQ